MTQKVETGSEQRSEERSLRVQWWELTASDFPGALDGDNWVLLFDHSPRGDEHNERVFLRRARSMAEELTD